MLDGTLSEHGSRAFGEPPEEEALLCGAMVGEQVRDEPGGGKQFLMDLREKGFHTDICAYVA